MKKNYCIFLLLLISYSTLGQQTPKPTAAELYHQIQKLNFLGTVLYIAAHPDDENTKLISYLSNEKKARTGYLSLTRGDGGQNLIGPELREFLGVIRTQELIEARKIDGGEQFFSRANDFGFSKNPEETLQIWDKNQVLSDVIWVIRKFQPDIIINRFDHRTPGTTHGHHTSSALLSVEAFDKVNDSSVFPEQLQYVKNYQPKRLFFNTSWWFYGSKEKFDQADKTNLISLNTGVYYPLTGKSNQEIAALSRSRHQSQGFGTSGTRGEEQEYLEFLKGSPLNDKTNIFEGIDTSWNRIQEGKQIGDLLYQVEKKFDFNNPSASIPELVKAYDLIQKIKDEHWRTIKTEEIKKIISGCAGLFIEAISENQEATPNSDLKIKLEVINRSQIPMIWHSIQTNPVSDHQINSENLIFNKDITQNITVHLNQNMDFTSPYYLKQKGTLGMYHVEEQDNIGKPDIIRPIKVTFTIEINGIYIPFERNVIYKFNDEVNGEVYQPLDIIPQVSVSIEEKIILFNNDKARNITVRVKAGKDQIKGTVQLEIPKNWMVFPKEITFEMAKKGEEQFFNFSITPPKESCEATIKCLVNTDNNTFTNQQINIHYPHIYNQMIVKEAQSKAIKIDIKTGKEKIGYIMGAGDEVPKCLTQMGYDLIILKPEEITTEKMQFLDVIITGIRAYNVVKPLHFKQNILLDFVKSGKTMIVQYNTTDELIINNIAPYPLKISRDRVTEENAEVRFLQPNHPVLNVPNKITTDDFKNWKQEQGLYYPNEFDNHFVPILSSNDQGEKPKNGALLIAKYGKGTYIYTGLSFFRELPEGVSGAYRLMANMISIKP